MHFNSNTVIGEKNLTAHDGLLSAFLSNGLSQFIFAVTL